MGIFLPELIKTKVMTEQQKQHMDIAYKEQLQKGTITNLDGALGFKLGYEAALKQGQTLPIHSVVDSAFCSCDLPNHVGLSLDTNKPCPYCKKPFKKH